MRPDTRTRSKVMQSRSRLACCRLWRCTTRGPPIGPTSGHCQARRHWASWKKKSQSIGGMRTFLPNSKKQRQVRTGKPELEAPLRVLISHEYASCAGAVGIKKPVATLFPVAGVDGAADCTSFVLC